MSGVVRQSNRPSQTGLMWWDVKLVLDADSHDRLVHCTFLALDEASARLRGVDFAKGEGQIIKSMVVSPSDAANRHGMAPIPKDSAPVIHTPPEKPKVTPEQARAIAAFTMVPINFPEIRLYTSDGGKT